MAKPARKPITPVMILDNGSHYTPSGQKRDRALRQAFQRALREQIRSFAEAVDSDEKPT